MKAARFKAQRMNSSGNWIFLGASTTIEGAYAFLSGKWGVLRVIDSETGKEV